MKSRMICLIILLALVISLQNIQALENVTKQDAEYCLGISRQYMDEMSKENFSVQRINDTLKIALEVFAAQELQKNADYSFVLSSCEEISNIRKLAYETKDLLYALEKDYSSFKEKVSRYKVDTSSIDSMMEIIRQDFQSERYEEFKEELPELEKKMAEVEASATTLNLFYRTTVTTLKSFLFENYIAILSIVAVLLVFFFLYRFELRRMILMKKIKDLELEKKVLKRLIQNTQREYFNKGSIPEATYHIRINRFAEMIRDIDRQIPILQEEIARLQSLGKLK